MLEEAPLRYNPSARAAADPSFASPLPGNGHPGGHLVTDDAVRPPPIGNDERGRVRPQSAHVTRGPRGT
eukprot:7330068-Lingulodinium_polyedra.AAC.1